MAKWKQIEAYPTSQHVLTSSRNKPCIVHVSVEIEYWKEVMLLNKVQL